VLLFAQPSRLHQRLLSSIEPLQQCTATLEELSLRQMSTCSSLFDKHPSAARYWSANDASKVSEAWTCSARTSSILSESADVCFFLFLPLRYLEEALSIIDDSLAVKLRCTLFAKDSVADDSNVAARSGDKHFMVVKWEDSMLLCSWFSESQRSLSALDLLASLMAINPNE
jgi:hypothetical protein